MVAHVSNTSGEELVESCWVVSLTTICQIPACMEPDAGPLYSFWHPGTDGKGRAQTQENEDDLIFYLMAVAAFSVCGICDVQTHSVYGWLVYPHLLALLSHRPELSEERLWGPTWEHEDHSRLQRSALGSSFGRNIISFHSDFPSFYFFKAQTPR